MGLEWRPYVLPVSIQLHVSRSYSVLYCFCKVSEFTETEAIPILLPILLNLQGSNPIFGTDNIIDTNESAGASRNPLFDSTTGRPLIDEHSQRNALFGTDILDSLQETR